MSARVRSTALLAVTAVLAVPASAQAVERFASVGGALTGDCTVTPCTIERAAENQANPGDVVTVLPGNHDIGVGNLVIAEAIEVRGAPGQPIPTVTSASTSSGVTLNDAGASLRRLEIVHDDPANGTGAALVLIQPATVEGVIAHSGTNNNDASGCAYDIPTGTSALIRDSVCASSATDGQGLTVNTNGMGTTTLTVRNVTAVSAGDTGMRITGTPATDVLNLNATSVIASGPVAEHLQVRRRCQERDAGPLQLRPRERFRRRHDHAGGTGGRERPDQPDDPARVRQRCKWRLPPGAEFGGDDRPWVLGRGPRDG